MMRRSSFASRLAGPDPLVGIFQKSPSHQTTEILGGTGLDFVILDTEHAPFTAAQLDTCLLAAAAVDLPCLIRVSRNDPVEILAALDMGASGIVVPHVRSGAEARLAVAASRYYGGIRGFSASTRTGGYGSVPMGEHVRNADDGSVVICQVEDKAAVDAVAEIAATPGIAGLFVGRADLAVSIGVGIDDPRLDEATIVIASAARTSGIQCGTFLPDLARVDELKEIGLGFFVIGSDQSFTKHGAVHLSSAFRDREGTLDPPPDDFPVDDPTQALEALAAAFWALADGRVDCRISDLFVASGEMIVGALHARGHDEIESFFARRRADPGRQTRHLAGGLLIELSGVEATALSTVCVYSGSGAPPLPIAPPSTIADVDDVFQWNAGVWRFRSRTVRPVFFGPGAPAHLRPAAAKGE